MVEEAPIGKKHQAKTRNDHIRSAGQRCDVSVNAPSVAECLAHDHE
jgi:hypothetical protein